MSTPIDRNGHVGPGADSAPGQPDVRWLGHASSLITDRGVRVLTDPVFTSRLIHLRRRRGSVADILLPDVLAPDVVVLSHLHADHTHLPSLRMIADGVPFVVPTGAADQVRGLRRQGARLIEVDAGDEVTVDGPTGSVTIRAVPADHDGRRWPRGPQSVAALGYVVTGDITTYFSGDTDLYPDLAQWVPHADRALLPVGGWGPNLGPGHLNPERAVTAAERVGAQVSIPIHFGTLWPIGFDRVRPERFFDPGAEFVRLAGQDGLDAVELHPGQALGEVRGA